MKIVALILALVSPSVSYPQIKAAVAAVRAQQPAERAPAFRGQYDIMDCSESDYTGGVATRASVYAFIAGKV